MLQPQLSVVIPAFNAEKYLGAAIESVLSQGHPALEIWVVNDGSTDRTAEVANSFGPKVHCISQAKTGAAAARNHGVEKAGGPYLAFLDADDLWTADKLNRQWLPLQSTDMVFGHLEQFLSPDMGPELALRYRCDPTPVPAHVAGTLLIRRQTFLETGLFEAWRVGEFIEWYDRARQKGLKETMLAPTLLRRRIHGANTTIRETDLGRDYLKIVRASLERKKQDGSRQDG